MTTTIAPSTGAGVLFTQQGVGTTPGYSAMDLRRSEIIGPVQEGVYASGDYMVTQRGAGANMSVDIAAASGAFAAVQGDSVTGQGLYVVGPHSAVINEAIAGSDPTNPRVDIVILEVQDNVHDATGGNLARTRVLTGTPTAGATLTNRTGAPALPANALLLADVLVGAAAGSIANTVIRDRRKWARGGYTRITATADQTTGSTTFVLVNNGVNPRLECSGVPVRLMLHGSFLNNTAGAQTLFDAGVDSAVNNSQLSGGATNYPASMIFPLHGVWDIIPAAGSHLFGPMWRVTAGTATLFGAGSGPIIFTVEEIVRQSTANNSTTSG